MNHLKNSQHRLTNQLDRHIDQLRNSFEWLNKEVAVAWSTKKVFLLIMALAAFMRTWQMDTHMIMFGDIGRDLLASYQILETGHIPLLGIPSSLPRFKQGPAMVWLMTPLIYLSQGSPLIVGYSMALLGTFTVALIYLLLERTVGKPGAEIGALFAAVSPLAVAQSRMPYHTAPIPFFTIVYLWFLYRLWEGKPHGLFFAVLSWAVLFQFELSLAPLALAIPYILWRRRRKIQTKTAFTVITGTAIGLAPQIVYDLTHGFQQLGGFIVWVGYRVVATTGFDGRHALTTSRITETVNSFQLYWTRIVSVDQPIWLITLLICLGVCGWFSFKNWKKLPAPLELTWMLFITLTIGYFIHGKPSEAYFPAYIVFFSLIIGYLTTFLRSKIHWFVITGLLIWNTMNIVAIFKQNFFVLPAQGNFHYGPGYQEIKSVVTTFLTEAQGHDYQLVSTAQGSEFPSYLDHYRYEAKVAGHPENSTDPDFLFSIEKPDSLLSNTLGAKSILFSHTTLVVLPQ